ncbi:MAG: hypothetical protein NVSMB6_28230 [Burkholderiaceae bacterium]
MSSLTRKDIPIVPVADHQAADWKALHELSKTLLIRGPLEQKLQDALVTVCGFHQTERSVISLYDPQTGTLGVRASVGMDPRALVGLNGVVPGSGACGRAFLSRERFVVEQFDQESCLTEYQPWASEFSIGAVYSTPFFDSAHAVMGVLSLYFHKPHRPTEREMQLSDLCAGTIALFLDRARSEEAVVYSEARYRVLTQTLSAIVWSYQPLASGFSDVRGWETFTGQSATEYAGNGWLDAVHPEDRERVGGAWAGAMESNKTYECFYRLLREDGKYRQVRAIATPVHDAAGVTKEWIGSCEDITAVREAQDHLTATNRRKDEFLAVLSHELRNPLSATKTAAALLDRPEIGTPRTAHIGQVINRQVGHMSRLVEDLVDVSRIAQGLVKLNVDRVDLVDVVKAAIEQVMPMINAKHHALDLQMPESCSVNGDKTRLVQVVVNLLSNAARYTPDNGQILVHVHTTEDAVNLTVNDNGIGIEPHILPALFDLYVQAERSSDRANGGLGLGLALVKSLVELHGGTVVVSSDGRDLGSSFRIQLPLSSPAGSSCMPP